MGSLIEAKCSNFALKHIQISELYMLKGEKDKALEYYLNALKIYEKDFDENINV